MLSYNFGLMKQKISYLNLLNYYTYKHTNYLRIIITKLFNITRFAQTQISINIL